MTHGQSTTENAEKAPNATEITHGNQSNNQEHLIQMGATTNQMGVHHANNFIPNQNPQSVHSIVHNGHVTQT